MSRGDGGFGDPDFGGGDYDGPDLGDPDFEEQVSGRRDVGEELPEGEGPVLAPDEAAEDAVLRHVLDAVRGGAHTSYDVAGELPWTRHGRRLPELDVFNTAMATLETRAHLELLVARGDLARSESDGVDLYAPC